MWRWRSTRRKDEFQLYQPEYSTSLKVWQLGMNFELLFTPEVIPPNRWVSNSSCKRGLGRNRQSIPSIIQQCYYTLSNLPPETFFRGQEDLLANMTSIYGQQLRVNIYCIFLFQMGSNSECIRFCIYNRVAAYGPIAQLLPLFVSLPALSLKPNPLFFV